MKVKTSELTGATLDWAVGQADECDLAPVEYSTKWEFGGLIIEREGISVYFENGDWHAKAQSKPVTYYDYSPLVAAMRCYVASKLGDEVEVPEELY